MITHGVVDDDDKTGTKKEMLEEGMKKELEETLMQLMNSRFLKVLPVF